MRKTLLLLILTLFSFSAIHAEIEWTLSEDGTLSISGTGNMPNYGINQTPWYNDRNKIKEVVIEDGVTSIGDRAFDCCTSLTSVEIPNSVTSIGESAFAWCQGLSSITFKGSTPPTFGNDVFDYVDKSIPIYVPAHRGEIYKNALGGYFSNIQANPKQLILTDDEPYTKDSRSYGV